MLNSQTSLTPLPIDELCQDLIAWSSSSAADRNALIQAPTGSGKSTRVPLYLSQELCKEGKKVVVLQPRRIAARMLAQRVAQERGVKLGEEVGYQVRFENVSSKSTQILFVTEGVMLRRLLKDPQMSDVACIVIDEFHERHLDGDMCLAWARTLQQSTRPDLRIVVMSATMDAELVTEYLKPCRVFHSEGRTFPVSLQYQASRKDARGWDEPVWDQVSRAFQSWRGQMEAEGKELGHVLVFLPGGYEIRKTIAALSQLRETRGYKILPLHGELPPKDQDEVLKKSAERKIIVSTNVAETSLTIDGIVCVIDSGLARIPAFDARRGINTLTIERISQASADQRAGRAGRLCAGTAIRLWSEREHANRIAHTPAEVHRLDLSEACLAFSVIQEKTELPLDWFDTPKSTALHRAEKTLLDVGAWKLDANHVAKLTDQGLRMSEFPLHPRFACMLLAADRMQCLSLACLCAAIAQGRDFLLKPTETTKRKQESFFEKADESEFWSRIRAFLKAEELSFDPQACQTYGIHGRSAYDVARTYDQLLGICKRHGLDLTQSEAGEKNLSKVLLVAFSSNLGVETGAGSRVYQLTEGFKGHLEKDSGIKVPRLLVASEIAEIQGKSLQVKLNFVTQVQEVWLEELYPDEVFLEQVARYDGSVKRVYAHEEKRFRDLVLSSKEKGLPTEEAAAQLLAVEVNAGRLVLPLWTEKTDQWIIRLNCLAKWMPELGLPAIGEEERAWLVEQVCLGCYSQKDLKEARPEKVLNSWLSHTQREWLDQYAPETLALPNGKRGRMEYREDQLPKMSAILQSLYEMKQNPRIANGTVEVLVELLAPNQRPVQLTADLAGFWSNSYPTIKTQLKGRYPKHEWR